jgi:tol-pal system protein YbgF
MKRAAILLLAGLLGGCATSGDMQKLQSQISELQDELAAIKRTASSKEEVQNINQRSAEQTEQLLKSNATLVAKVEQMDERIQNAQGSAEQTNYRLDRMAQQVTAMQRDVDDMKARAAAASTPPGGTPAMSEVNVPPPASGGGTAATAPPSANPIDVYNAAYRDYQRGNFDLAISGFRDFIAQNPNSDLTDNASYWIGESLFSQKKYQDAIAQFDSVVTKFPKSEKVPGALLKKGYAYIALGEKSQGIVQLQYVLHEHPRSPEADLARQKLKQLGVETR